MRKDLGLEIDPVAYQELITAAALKAGLQGSEALTKIQTIMGG
jgi:hypothetical protein